MSESMRPLPLPALALGVAATALAAVQPAASRPSVVLVTLDTTRADRMGFLGSRRGLTPELDRLATQSVVFERAYAQAPLTTVSHATLLTGTYPQRHRVNDFGVPLDPGLPYLPEILRQRGYRTAAFVGSLILDPRAGLAPGFDRGFDTYDAAYRMRLGKDDRYQTLERRGALVVDRALAWLGSQPAGPFLLWVHLFDAHDPYDPPAAWKARHAKEPYDGEIAYLDAQVGRLLAGLGQRLDGAITAVFSDHGEALGEHGEKTHGVFLYDETIRVPLLLRLPGGRHAGSRVATRASLVDLAPTVLDALGIERPGPMQGESLLGLVASARAAERPAYAETDYPRRAFGWSPLAAWREDRFLYVKAPRPELYDLAGDAGATRDLADERGMVAGRIGERLEAFRRETSAAGAEPARRPIDAALLERLAALGYVSGAAVAPLAGAGIDPKDKVAVANDLHDAIVHVESDELTKALPLLQRVTASDPQIPMAQVQLGIALCRQRRYPEALPVLKKAIALQPDAMTAHYEMGMALYETGDWKTAAAHFEIVAERMPRFVDARFSLGSVYARTNRIPEAERELAAALELEPRHYRANLLLGRLRDLQGRSAEGLPLLERAVAVQPASAEAHAFLADAYARLGRGKDAERERSRAASLRAAPRP
jgi:arylsulfatase A-like enzyme/uncharacterized protein HemY